MKSGHIQEFASYSKFQDLRDFNNHMEQWMVDNKKEFSKGELIGLKRLVRYSAKVPGVCNAKIQTLVAACGEMGGISRRTLERMLVKAKRLGLLEVKHTFKGTGKQGHNLFIFNPYASCGSSFSPNNDVPEQKTIDAPIIETTIPNKTIKNNNKRYENTILYIPLKFQELAKIAFSAEQINELWKAVRQEAYKTNHLANVEKVHSVAVHSIRILIGAIKRFEIVNKIGYFKRILANVFAQLSCKPIEQFIGEVKNPKRDTLPPWVLKAEERKGLATEAHKKAVTRAPRKVDARAAKELQELIASL
jgi:hypothetical protein